MPKLKTRKGIAKRFRKTAKGKFKRGCAFKGHILTKKRKKRKRRLRRGALVHGALNRTLRALMPYS